jgi:hypothetical protein
MKTTILKYLLMAAKIAGAITVLFTSSFGVYKFFEKKVVEDYTSKNDIEIIKESQKVALDSIISISRQIQPLRALPDRIDEQKGAINGLRTVVLDHVSKDKAMTIDQFRQYMETAPEVKKNFNPIVLK